MGNRLEPGREARALLKGVQLQKDLDKNILRKILCLLGVSGHLSALLTNRLVVASVEDVNAVTGLMGEIDPNQLFVGQRRFHGVRVVRRLKERVSGALLEQIKLIHGVS